MLIRHLVGKTICKLKDASGFSLLEKPPIAQCSVLDTLIASSKCLNENIRLGKRGKRTRIDCLAEHIRQRR